MRNQLTPAACNFASAPWHYDFNDHRAPHDGWVEETVIGEAASGERKEHRSLEIVIKLFGAYHDCQAGVDGSLNAAMFPISGRRSRVLADNRLPRRA